MGYPLRILRPAANDYRLLTVNYYDDYSFLYIEGTAASQLAYRSKEGYGAAYSSAKGLLTGTQVFDLTDRSKYAITVYYYDEYGNPVQTRTRHVSGDYEMTYAQCDLSGNILKSYTEHLDSRGRLSVSESVENTYDRSGRLTRTDYAVNDSLSTDWIYEYDELGRISSKSIDGGLTHAKYRYNLQGWITRIEDVDFVQNLYYENFMGNYGKVRYNGNISAMNWTYRTDTDTIVNGYRFTYDAYDRLASAYSVTGSDFSSGRYHVEYEYDKHGNMVNLYRNGGRGGMIDEMNWFYEGNRVVEITDMVGEQGRYDMKEYRDYNHNGLDYFYDSNGNMTADLDRDIVAIRYNLLNLPDTVQFRNGSAIVNYYTADGKRTGSKYLTPQTTVVIPAGQPFGSTSGTAAMSSHVTARRGSLEYAGADFESDTLIRIHNGDGYLDCSEQDFRYFVRDYQGNIRTVYGSAVAKLIPVEPPFSLTNRGAIGGDKPPIRPKPIEHTVTYQRMQYYPFGLPYEAHYQPEEQPYKYGGKEFIELHGYDSYDFDARMYYPALCRFMTMDPLCEKYYSISPYAYCNNNPVNYVDPDGRDIWEIDYDGRIINRIENKTQDAFYMVAKDSNGDYQRTFSVDEDGNKKYNSINFEYGVITDSKKAWFFNQETSFSINNESDGANLFKFFANNTKIEFGLINTQNNGSLVMTNHQEHSIKVSKQAKRLSMNGATVTSIVHNHPNNSYPSGFRKKDNHGDKYAAALISNSKGYRVEHYVYQPQKGRLIMYDKNKIIGPIPWEYLFSSNNLHHLGLVPLRFSP